jgi:hypothetical protein
MDTTIPVQSVRVVVTSGTSTAGYVAQVNGHYFAAKVPVSADTTLITAIATDQTGSQHQASATVSITAPASNIDLTAAPGVGIPMQRGINPASLDVNLMSTPTATNPVVSYAWDFDGSGSDDVTCYSHSNILASYQQTGLYLTQITATDTAGNQYRDTAIVNVLDRTKMDDIFKPIWNGMKSALISGETGRALAFIAPKSRQKYSDAFTALQANISEIAAGMQDIQLVYVKDTMAKYRIKSDELFDGQNKTITYYIYFRKDQYGQWLIDQF